MTCQQLPPEIWIEIFEWIFTPNSSLAPSYAPFRTVQACYRKSVLPNTEVGRTLALVCRRWRNWSIAFFYRDIQVEREAYALKHTLQGSTTEQYGYSTWVRRVVLPYPSTVTIAGHPGIHATSIEIMKLCTQLEVLVRPPPQATDTLLYDLDADRVSMPTLRRLEWWHNEAAERTGGINSLSSVLHGSPKLESLFLCGSSDYSRLRMEGRQLVLPALQTLRLHNIGGLLLHQITSAWLLPALGQVIVDSPIADHGLDTLWETFGPQLRIAEFGKHPRFLLSDNISPCLEHCPHLSEFNYYLFFTHVPNIREAHNSVTNIGLHAAFNAFLEEQMAWDHIERHFDVLIGGALPALRSITLHGSWEDIMAHPGFQGLRERVYKSGCVLVKQVNKFL